MNKTIVVFGSSTGTCEAIAEKIASKLGAEVINVQDLTADVVADNQNLILGTSTWGDGEVESDWYDFLDGAEVMDLKGKKIAFFGCGDESMSTTFCNGVGELYKRMKGSGADPIGAYNVIPYKFDNSDAIIDGVCVGLLLDEVNHPELTDERIKAWTELIKHE